jgi:hypothetical protein
MASYYKARIRTSQNKAPVPGQTYDDAACYTRQDTWVGCFFVCLFWSWLTESKRFSVHPLLAAMPTQYCTPWKSWPSFNITRPQNITGTVSHSKPWCILLSSWIQFRLCLRMFSCTWLVHYIIIPLGISNLIVNPIFAVHGHSLGYNSFYFTNSILLYLLCKLQEMSFSSKANNGWWLFFT